LDYKQHDLYINGIMVTSLTIVGVLVEEMFKVSRRQEINYGALNEADLPDVVYLTLDRRGERQVLCYDADRALAIRLGKLIRANLLTCYLEVKQVCVPVLSGGKKVGEHDLICEVVGGTGSDQIRKYLSVEIKLRVLYSPKGLVKVRTKQQKECCKELKWWLAEEGNFSGRLILLGCFMELPSDRRDANEYKMNTFRLFGDLKMRGEQAFRGIFGWGDALPKVAWVLQAASRTAPKLKPAAPVRASTTNIAAKSRQSSRSSSGKAFTDMVDELGFSGGYCEVGAFLKKIGKNSSKASYWAKKAQRRHSWPERDIMQKPRLLKVSASWRCARVVCQQTGFERDVQRLLSLLIPCS